MTVFLDTGVLVAAANGQDGRHKAAVALLDELRSGTWGPPFTSDFVLAEGFNFLRRKMRTGAAAESMHDLVFGSPRSRPFVEAVYRVHSPVFAAALAAYRSRWEAGLSLTDWTIVHLMAEHGVEVLATFDGGFEPWVRIVPVPTSSSARRSR